MTILEQIKQNAQTNGSKTAYFAENPSGGDCLKTKML